MMKYTPRVRSEIAPMTQEASAETAIASGQPADPGTGEAFGDADARHVGAGADKGGMTDRNHSAIAQRQVQAGRGDGVDHHAAGEADVEQAVRGLHRDREQQENGQQENILLHPRAGNRPFGLKYRMTAISR